jgi:hypothetical protein
MEKISINPEERLNLKRMINETNCEDNTDNIRKLKHSSLIQTDITKLQELKKDNSHRDMKLNHPEQFLEHCRNECMFLFSNYTEIFNKICKDELNMEIMWNVLQVLRAIEEGDVDQHEGSVVFGKLLKKLYIDSAVKEGDNLDKDNIVEPIIYVESKPISWKDYKKTI